MKISQFPVRKFTRAGILTSALMLSQANALAEQVTLDDAVQLTLNRHPSLLKFRPLTRALEGDRQQALLSPAYTVGANLENVMGTSSWKEECKNTGCGCQSCPFRFRAVFNVSLTTWWAHSAVYSRSGTTGASANS